MDITLALFHIAGAPTHRSPVTGFRLFVGSGSTLIAAKSRVCLGMEFDP